ncbi:MAG: SDR family NAD(P)-dependent oxidoreductase [Campylobacterales bacterium]|jgi:NAD(P)-dependent dehydrogenase (short-subunit alcohol dehydrogenase family)
MNIWIVGGSSGIGLELVKRWLMQGHRVVASARGAERSEALEALHNVYEPQLLRLDLDVTRSDKTEEACRRAWDAFGGLDLWFYNAGAYEPMRAEAWELSHFERMAQINYLGAVRLMTHLLPYFERQGHGRWVFNGSLASYFGLPYGGGYSAPKAALMNLAESIQPELLAKNIKLQTINHGFVKTRLTDKNDFDMPELMAVETAAEKIAEALEGPYRFETHFPPKLSFFLRMLRVLPYGIALALTRRMLK